MILDMRLMYQNKVFDNGLLQVTKIRILKSSITVTGAGFSLISLFETRRICDPPELCSKFAAWNFCVNSLTSKS